jgi:hydroxymethylglutaryl-CoA lyase
MQPVKIIECPRDAWQGLPHSIPTEAKVAYLRKLIEAGFRHLDAVSFVAPKYVPQMADSEQVLEGLREAGVLPRKPSGMGGDLENRNSKIEIRKSVDPNFEFRASSFESCPEIIGIVVNEAGLERALHASGVTTLGYPYSVSANFRRANANMSKAESQALVEKMQKTVTAPNAPVRRLVVYISMAFGNNYGEPWGPEIVIEAVEWLREIGVRQVSLADTIGTASPQEVGDLFRAVRHAIPDSGSRSASTATPDFELGVHLHSRPEGTAEKVLAAYEAGCRRFDCALTGLGGCPFAADDLVGNIPTEIVVSTLSAKGADTGIEPWALLSAVKATKELRTQYANA